MSIALIHAVLLRRAVWRAWDTGDVVALGQLLRAEAMAINALVGWDVACYMHWRYDYEAQRAAARTRGAAA